MKPPPTPHVESLSGLIERVTFFNEENGFAVLKVKAKGHRDQVTVIGSVPSVSAGEWLTAEGKWIELGNLEEANAELENITPQLRAHPRVLEVRFKIYSEAGKWEMALEVARGLRNILPQTDCGHFFIAYALHELKRTQEAYDVLKAVIRIFPKHQMMHYNLACYSCQLGNLKESMMWLEKAIDLGGTVGGSSKGDSRANSKGDSNSPMISGEFPRQDCWHLRPRRV